MQKISSRQEKQNQHWSASYAILRLRTVKIWPISRGKDTQSANTILELPRNDRWCTYWNALKSRSEHPPFCSHSSSRNAFWKLVWQSDLDTLSKVLVLHGWAGWEVRYSLGCTQPFSGIPGTAALMWYQRRYNLFSSEPLHKCQVSVSQPEISQSALPSYFQ